MRHDRLWDLEVAIVQELHRMDCPVSDLEGSTVYRQKTKNMTLQERGKYFLDYLNKVIPEVYK